MTPPTPTELMQSALEAAREGISQGQSPFGCAIATADGRLLAAAHNTVVQSVDATAHAEVNAIRAACRTLGSHLLTGALVATTCEPCPMCLAALHWARVATVYYGATIADAAAAGFNELHVAASDLARLGGSPLRLVPGVSAPACRALFQQWQESANRVPY